MDYDYDYEYMFEDDDWEDTDEYDALIDDYDYYEQFDEQFIPPSKIERLKGWFSFKMWQIKGLLRLRRYPDEIPF